MSSALAAAVHFLAAFGVVAAVFSEWRIFNRTPTPAEATRLQRCDAWYGICAAVAIVAGLLRVYYFEKGSAVYLSNPIFLLKIGLFATAGLISIYPTVQFKKWRAVERTQQPALTDRQFSLIALALRLELTLFVGMIVAASLMAKGIGL